MPLLPAVALQAVNEAAADAMSEGKGGGKGGAVTAASSERRGTFTDLALCLAGGLDDAALSSLFKTAAVGLQVNSRSWLAAFSPGYALHHQSASSHRGWSFERSQPQEPGT